MTRQFVLQTIALSTLCVWLAATSACSGGEGASAVPDEEPDAMTVPVDDTGRELPDDSVPPRDGVPPPSPFDPEASAEPPGGGEDVEGAGGVAGPTAVDDGPELQRPIGEGSDTAAIAGFWEYRRPSADGIDVVRFAIDESGGLVEYDDQSDAVGSGADCHVVARGAIASRGLDRYDIQDSSTLPGSRSVDDVLITADGAEITFRYLGTAADPQLGGNLTGITERYPAVTDRSVDDLTICAS